MLKRFRSKHEHQKLEQLFQKPMADVFAETVYFIAIHDVRAIQVIEHAHKIGLRWDRVVVADSQVRFDGYRDATQEGRRCECCFELEYCDFIHGDVVDKAMLERTCENIRRGMCCHVTENTARRDKVEAYASLLHIAAGCDNKDVVKLLLSRGLLRRPRYNCFHRTSGTLLPVHIALAKSCIKSLGVLTDIDWDDECNTNGAWIAKRDQDTGKIRHFTYSKLARMHCFIQMANDETDEYVRKATKLFKSERDFCDLLKCLLSTDKEKLAYSYIKSSRRRCTVHGWYVTVYSVLLNDKEFLRTALRRGFYKESTLQLKVDYTILDIALVVGSSDCVDILKTSSCLTDGMYQRVSPYTLLLRFAAASDRMYPPFMVRMISKLHSLGHDINHQDEFRMTPLLYALYLLQDDPTVLHKLLSIGADTDAKDRNGRTALVWAITAKRSPVHSNRSCINSQVRLNRPFSKPTRGTLKDILFYNPDVKCSFNQRAVHYAEEMDSLIMHSSLRYLLQDDCVIRFKADSQDDQDEDIEAETFEDKVLALSYLALLHEFGFKITDALQYIDMGEQEHLIKLSDYLKKVESTPRTLQSWCRLVIRQTFPGRLVHKLLQSSRLPKTLQNYVVRPYILRYVEVEGFDGNGNPETVHVDYSGITINPPHSCS